MVVDGVVMELVIMVMYQMQLLTMKLNVYMHKIKLVIMYLVATVQVQKIVLSQTQDYKIIMKLQIQILHTRQLLIIMLVGIMTPMRDMVAVHMIALII